MYLVYFDLLDGDDRCMEISRFILVFWLEMNPEGK